MKKFNKFSIGLGLFDYINPIFYAITTITIILNINNIMNGSYFIIYILGAVISMIFGLTIPTVKLLVGLGKMEFKMPVNLVLYVNTGILISGTMLLKSVFDIKLSIIILMILLILMLLLFIYEKTNKFNTIAVLMGTFGYIFLYISLITLAVRSNIIISIILYSVAILFFVSLCTIGIKANLKDPKIHWIIETSNVLCQGLVALGTLLLFI